MLDHDFEPLLEILLHAHAAPLQQVLDSLDFGLQVFQLGVLRLVALLVLIYALLNLVFFLGAHQLAVVVYHAS